MKISALLWYRRNQGSLMVLPELADRCAAQGFETVSMRDAFETIYAETVAKTWTEELEAADRL